MVKESTPAYERETIINYNYEETEADIYTWDVRLQSHIEKKLGIKPYEIQEGARSYKVPKRWLRKPQKPSKAKSEAAKKRGFGRTLKNQPTTPV